MLNIQALVENNIKNVGFWVPPCPACLILGVTPQSSEKIDIVIRDEDDYDDSIPTHLIPRYISINDKRVDLESEEAQVVWLLLYLIEHDLLGHKEGIAVNVAKECIEYFKRSWTESV